MVTDNLIPATIFCTHHEVELSFVHSLQDFGLISVQRIDEQDYIPETEMQKLEKLIRLHYDLDVNLEGIDVINHLLTRMHSMENEIRQLKERLRFYESGD